MSRMDASDLTFDLKIQCFRVFGSPSFLFFVTIIWRGRFYNKRMKKNARMEKNSNIVYSRAISSSCFGSEHYPASGTRQTRWFWAIFARIHWRWRCLWRFICRYRHTPHTFDIVRHLSSPHRFPFLVRTISTNCEGNLTILHADESLVLYYLPEYDNRMCIASAGENAFSRKKRWLWLRLYEKRKHFPYESFGFSEKRRQRHYIRECRVVDGKRDVCKQSTFQWEKRAYRTIVGARSWRKFVDDSSASSVQAHSTRPNNV